MLTSDGGVLVGWLEKGVNCHPNLIGEPLEPPGKKTGRTSHAVPSGLNSFS